MRTALLRIRILLALAAAVLALAGCMPMGSSVPPQPTRTNGNNVPYSSSGRSGTPPRTTAEDTRVLDQRMRELTDTIVRHLPEGSRRTVAVADFVTLDGQSSVFGRYVAEELTTLLLDTGKVTVVERALLQKALDELHLNATDIVDPEKARQLGRVVGADAVATGTVTDRSADIKVNARLIDTENSTVLSGGSVVVQRSALQAIERGGSNGGNGGNGTVPDGEVSRPSGMPDDGGKGGSGFDESGSSSWYVDGYASPAEAWQAFLNGLANGDAELVMSATRPDDRYLITHLSIANIHAVFSQMMPNLQSIQFNSANVATGTIWISDGSAQNVFFERHSGRWFLVIDDDSYDPNDPDNWDDDEWDDE